MTQAQKNAPAQAPAVAVVQLKTSLETAGQFAKAIAQAASSSLTAMAKAERDLLGTTAKAAVLIGEPMNEAQWTKQFAGSVRKAMEAKRITEVSSALSRAKVIILCVLSGNADLQPRAGETANTFCARVRPLMGEVKLPNGDWLMTRDADGKPKPKAGAKQGAKKAAASAGDATKQEGGDNAPAKLRAAQILLGNTDAAMSLMVAAADFPERLTKFLADLMAAENRKDARKANSKAANSEHAAQHAEDLAA